MSDHHPTENEEDGTPIAALLRKLGVDPAGRPPMQALADAIRDLGWPARWKPTDPAPETEA